MQASPIVVITNCMKARDQILLAVFVILVNIFIMLDLGNSSSWYCYLLHLLLLWLQLATIYCTCTAAMASSSFFDSCLEETFPTNAVDGVVEISMSVEFGR